MTFVINHAIQERTVGNRMENLKDLETEFDNRGVQLKQPFIDQGTCGAHQAGTHPTGTQEKKNELKEQVNRPYKLINGNNTPSSSLVQEGKYPITCTTNYLRKQPWINDSGAMDHMIGC